MKIANAIAMCRPDSVFINTGSETDRQFIRDLAIERGEESVEDFEEKRLEEEFIGLGYFNIRSRIKSLNGSFDIYTQPGEGMKVLSKIKID